MEEEYKKYLYIFDLLGKPPQLRIFNHEKYKSSLTSILSIILFAFSIVFTIYSLIDFFKYKNPNVIYSKNNDNLTNRTFLIKDTLLIFGLIENSKFSPVNKEDSYFEAELKVKHKNGENYDIPIAIEPCEYGKNLDIKYQDKLSSFSFPMNQFYCISDKDANLPLFYDPEFGESSLYIYSKRNNNSKYMPDDLMIIIINGNDIIEHNAKDNPISDKYFTSIYTSFSSYKFSLINYYFQFVKYESDNGLFFPSNYLINAKSFSYSEAIYTNYIEQIDNLQMGTIMIQISKVNFDYYKRSYPRLQSLLAEVMSVINLFFGVAKFITDIFLEKKMSKDITKVLLNKASIIKLKNESNYDNKETIKDIENFNFMVESKNKINKSNYIQKDLSINTNLKTEIANKKIMDNLNYFHIIRSYFCCQNEKSKLINFCNDLINNDLCIENLFARLYELERTVNLLLNKKSQSNKLDEIINYILNIENNISDKT